MIIVEGPDNSGKSTLVARLSDEAKLLAISNKRKPKSKDEAFDFLNMAIPLSKKFPTIFDRWTPISEMVYGPLIRGTSIFTPHDIDVAMAAPILARLKPIVIYCRPSDSVIESTICHRQQMPGVVENLYELIQAYDQVIEHWSRTPTNSYPTVRYDFQDPQAYISVLSRVHLHVKEQFQ